MKLCVTTSSEWEGGEFCCSVSIGCCSEWAVAGMSQQPIREQLLSVYVRETERVSDESLVSHSLRGNKETESEVNIWML